MAASSHAELFAHVTRQAWSSGQLMVAPWHALTPTQATAQAHPGGQSTVWLAQPAQSMVQIPSASSQVEHTPGQLPPSGGTSCTQGPPVVVVSVEDPSSLLVPPEVAPDEPLVVPVSVEEPPPSLVPPEVVPDEPPVVPEVEPPDVVAEEAPLPVVSAESIQLGSGSRQPGAADIATSIATTSARSTRTTRIVPPFRVVGQMIGQQGCEDRDCGPTGSPIYWTSSRRLQERPKASMCQPERTRCIRATWPAGQSVAGIAAPLTSPTAVVSLTDPIVAS